jgi:hypothetical protein
MRAIAMVMLASALPTLILLGLAAAPAAAGACQPKFTTVSGHKAVDFCGPATATLSLGGSTHRFSGGTCTGSGSSLIIDLGETITGAGASDDGKSSFSIIIAGKTADVMASAGGHDLMKAGLALAEVPHGASAMGAFHGKLVTNAEPFTGSWNCHGSIDRT